ncbi:MAG: hypothetical protein MZV64_02000 [Ignavibacteriales bacterium]|nr:hypothetical protein [Ignavibacteriales bacterium]
MLKSIVCIHNRNYSLYVLCDIIIAFYREGIQEFDAKLSLKAKESNCSKICLTKRAKLKLETKVERDSPERSPKSAEAKRNYSLKSSLYFPQKIYQDEI